MFRFVKSATFIALMLGSAAAYAQATRTWVSGVGDDVNPCSRTAPCKTFAGAIVKTAAGGEIDVLDPGAFGTVTITKSITIDGGSTFAGVLASATNGINVNAGDTDVVILRNLSINGAGTTMGLNGVNYLAGANLTVENCVIMNFRQSGIAVFPATNNAMAVIRNVQFDSNAFGVQVNTSNASGSVVTTIVDSSFRGTSNAGGGTVLNTTGIAVTRPAGKPLPVLTVRNSDLSDFNAAVSNSGGNLTVDRSLLMRSNVGVDTSNSGNTNLNLNTFVNNVTQFTTGGTVFSAGNNTMVGGISTPNGAAIQLK